MDIERPSDVTMIETFFGIWPDSPGRARYSGWTVPPKAEVWTTTKMKAG